MRRATISPCWWANTPALGSEIRTTPGNHDYLAEGDVVVESDPDADLTGIGRDDRIAAAPDSTAALPMLGRRAGTRGARRAGAGRRGRAGPRGRPAPAPRP